MDLNNDMHMHACRNTRTCIHTPGSSPLDPQELPSGALSQILDGACILYLDGRLADTALLLAKQVLKLYFINKDSEMCRKKNLKIYNH